MSERNFPRSSSEATLGYGMRPAALDIEDLRRRLASFEEVHADSGRLAKARYPGGGTSSARQRAEERREQPPPWFKARAAAAAALRAHLWAKEACEKAVPPRTLITHRAS